MDDSEESKDDIDETVPLLNESNNSQSIEEDFDSFAYSRLYNIPANRTSSPKRKEFREFCNFYIDPERPSTSNLQEKIADASYSNPETPVNQWPPFFVPHYAIEENYQDQQARNQFSSGIYHENQELPYQNSPLSDVLASGGTGTTVPLFASNSYVQCDPMDLPLAYRIKYGCNRTPRSITKRTPDSPTVSENAHSSQATAPEPGSFAEIEEFAYGPLPNEKCAYSQLAKTYEELYNYYTDVTRPPGSKFLPMIRRNYENANRAPPTPRPQCSTALSSPPRFRSPVPLQLDANRMRMVENLRQLRHANLLKWWALHSITNERPPLLVNCDTSANTSGTSGVTPDQASSVVICKFCVKNGESPIVYENHSIKDADGNVTCPVLQKHKCEICNATGMNAHTKKHCPYNTERNPRLPQYRVLANGSISTNLNHK